VFVDCPIDGENATVTHLVAVESVSHRLAESGFEAARAIKVRRTNTSFPGSEARALQRTWSSMFANADVETGTTVRERRRDYFFSVARPGRFRGRLGTVARNPGFDTSAADLVSITEILGRCADTGTDSSLLSNFRTLLARLQAG
jgi:hypothetical protein